jgi:uncharacterized protein (DUF433 family)
MVIRWRDHIEERKDVMMGKPVFKGTRLTVAHVLKEMGAGMTERELLENYPTLRPEHIRAALLARMAIGRAADDHFPRIPHRKARPRTVFVNSC